VVSFPQVSSPNRCIYLCCPHTCYMSRPIAKTHNQNQRLFPSDGWNLCLTLSALCHLLFFCPYILRFRNLQVYNYELERMGEFKYLGSLITENSGNSTDIKARILAGNSYYSVLPLLRSKAVSMTTKTRMYKTIIRPVVLCG